MGLVGLMGMVACLWGAEPEGAAEKEEETETEQAEIEVRGFGLFGNRDLKKTLAILQVNERFPEVLDANFVEDAVMILLARLEDDGYLAAEIETRMIFEEGGEIIQVWRRGEDILLPRPLRVARLEIRVEEGVRYHYENVAFEGLTVLPDAAAKRYFLEMDTLLRLRGGRIYNTTHHQNSIENLQLALRRLGFHDARVWSESIEPDERTGEVDVVIGVEEGLCWRVRDVATLWQGPVAEVAGVSNTTQRVGEAFSEWWEQDFLQDQRVRMYELGFPDAQAFLSRTNQHRVGRTNFVDLEVTAQSGPRIRLGEIAYRGLEKTRPEVVERRVPLESGDWLNRLAVDRARFDLARLGVFDSVDLRYEPTERDRNIHDLVFELEEGRRVDFNLLFGYGSYELLRGGFELDQHNLFGLAHHSRLRAIQSFKATMADYLYTVPDLWGRDLNLFFNAGGLRREEVSFEREELLLGLGGSRVLPAIDSEVGVRYNYEFLNANDPEANLTVDEEAVRVGALVFDFKHDRRDSPLMPRQGYKVFANLEVASAGLGGEVDYQRLDTSASWHLGLGRGSYLHLGLSQGIALTWDSDDSDLPINKRFFPGGETSIRGYQQGEASPRNEQGDLFGAETYLLGNVEYEQKLTRNFSLVVLFDAIGFAEHVEDYPMDEELYSVGGGIWWKTLIGPVRLEYGHNLNPRAKDPSGTLHFSLGFPF